MATTGWGGPNPGRSGTDPRGRLQNQSGYQQSRFENQQGPAASEFARQFGRGAETQYDDYNDIMGRFGKMASGGGGVNAGQVGFGRIGDPTKVTYTDPYKSYGGYEEFSKTGGYSPTDIANLRSRGTSPIRAAYANAEREVSRGRALQGGYSPNAAAVQAKMAREQGQSAADAMQNVEAGIVQGRNAGRLSGLGGMKGIEDQRLNAELESGMFNSKAQQDAAMFNSTGQLNADQFNVNSQLTADELNGRNQLGALQGMSNLYGTTPGMAQLFGNQLNTSIGQGGNYGIAQQGADYNSQQLPGAYDTAMGKVGDFMDLGGAASTAAYPWLRGGQGQYPQNQGYTKPEPWSNQQQPPRQQKRQPFMGPQQTPYDYGFGGYNWPG